jgi:hypothetical protein
VTGEIWLTRGDVNAVDDRSLVAVVEGEVVPDPSVTVFRSAASVVAAVVVDVVDRE